MNADLGKLTAPRRVVRIDGMDWEFSPLTLRDNEELLDEMTASWPRPLATVKQHLDGLNDAERLRILEMATSMEMRPKAPSAMEFELWKVGPFGEPRAWWRMLRQAHSAITLEQAATLCELAKHEAEVKARANGVNDVPLGNSPAPEAGASPEQW